MNLVCFRHARKTLRASTISSTDSFRLRVHRLSGSRYSDHPRTLWVSLPSPFVCLKNGHKTHTDKTPKQAVLKRLMSGLTFGGSQSALLNAHKHVKAICSHNHWTCPACHQLCNVRTFVWMYCVQIWQFSCLVKNRCYLLNIPFLCVNNELRVGI